jgi:16S rRNA (adenine1518-N6/adenine1519-N6)-dimethyltransferase
MARHRGGRLTRHAIGAITPAMTLPPLREVIARHGLDARKSLGQHFLLDENLTGKIARQAGDLAGRHVIEVGPGPGGLTRALLATDAASVTAVEIDPRAAAAIRELQAGHAGRLHLVEADALKADLSALVPAPRQIVANLPYNAGTPMLIAWLRQAAQWERLTLMFQLEVAERICAAPDTPAYGRLSALAQLICSAGIAMRLPPSAFTPPPNVMSAVVSLVPHTVQPAPELFRAMERLTAAAFGQRRKMLRGSLRALGGEALLARAGIDGQRRAETLSVAELATLAGLLLVPA